jgi:SAM-dependent methyltransferase
MTLLTQDDIRTYYEKTWKECDDATTEGEAGLVNSGPVEDAVLYPIYEQLIRDLNIPVNGGRVLDVGAGSGRWVRFFTRRFKPASLTALDFTRAAVDLLERRYSNLPGIATRFQTADFTKPGLDLGQRFDLINVMNVLFHIPEPERFTAAMANLARHLAPGGRIVSTEYLPRITMRTNWMLVRSRYDFEAAAAAAGLRIAAIRASCFYSNDPMGVDGPDEGQRAQFYAVHTGMKQILASQMDDKTRQFFVKFLVDVETSAMSFCRERMADVDMPSQKLVALAAA